MPQNNELRERLSRYREVNLSVIGRKSGKNITVPVWQVVEGDKLYLLPVHGSDTQWYRNMLKHREIRIDAKGAERKLEAMPITEPRDVQAVIEKFQKKYGAQDVKKYYSKFDVAVLAPLDR